MLLIFYACLLCDIFNEDLSILMDFVEKIFEEYYPALYLLPILKMIDGEHENIFRSKNGRVTADDIFKILEQGQADDQNLLQSLGLGDWLDAKGQLAKEKKDAPKEQKVAGAAGGGGGGDKPPKKDFEEFIKAAITNLKKLFRSSKMIMLSGGLGLVALIDFLYKLYGCWKKYEGGDRSGWDDLWKGDNIMKNIGHLIFSSATLVFAAIGLHQTFRGGGENSDLLKLQQKLDGLQNKIDEKDKLQKKLDGLQNKIDEKDKLQKKLDGLQEKLDKKDVDNKALQKKCAEKDKLLEKKDNIIEAKDADNKALQNIIVEKDADNKALQNIIVEKDAEIKDLNQENKTLLEKTAALMATVLQDVRKEAYEKRHASSAESLEAVVESSEGLSNFFANNAAATA